MNSTFLCGAAAGDITPGAELLAHLHGLKSQHFGGVLDPIRVRVIAAGCPQSVILIAVFELDKVPCADRFTAALTSAFGIPEDHLLLAAVHTHTAPVAGTREHEGPNNTAGKPADVQAAMRRYEDLLERRLVGTAGEALSSMRPARMGFGTGTSYINVCRNRVYEYTDDGGALHHMFAIGADPSVPIDHTVSVLRFESTDGSPIAFLVNYPVHCCVLHTCHVFGEGLGLSGDIAGRISAGLERQYPGSVAIWCSGAAGDINPIVQNELAWPDPATGKPVFCSLPGDNRALLDFVSAQHYADVRRTAEGIRCEEDAPDTGCRVGWVRAPGMTGDYDVRLQMVRLGKVLLIGASGELYNAHGQMLKALFPDFRVMVLNHVSSLNPNSGYILSDEVLEAGEAQLPGLRDTNMRPGYFMNALREQALQLHRQLVT